MQSSASTVEEYLQELPPDRLEAILEVRATILANLPKGFEEGMQYGMIGYYVPHRLYPGGYHCDPKQPLPFASLASQKNHMAVYMMGLYSQQEDQEWFRKAWAKTGKKLDMGKSCIRFKKLDDLPLQLIGQAIKRFPVRKYIAIYESQIESMTKSPKAAAKKKSGAKSTTKSSKSRSPASGKTATKKTSAAGSTTRKKPMK